MITTRYYILQYLFGKNYVSAGKIGREVHKMSGAKESQVERRLRELREEGVLESINAQVNGEGPWFVCYKLRPK